MYASYVGLEKAWAPDGKSVGDETAIFFSSRRRHTRYIGDWSSDVCSSDLRRFQRTGGAEVRARAPAAEPAAPSEIAGTPRAGAGETREMRTVPEPSVAAGGQRHDERFSGSRSSSEATYQNGAAGAERSSSPGVRRGSLGTGDRGSSPAASVSKTMGHESAFGARKMGA